MFEKLSLIAATIAAVLFTSFITAQASGNNCGKYSTKMNQNVFSRHRFRSRIIESTSISRPLECYAKCLKNCVCLSFNVCNGGRKCELNSEKKESDVSLYETTDDCDYYEYDYSKESASGHCLDTCCSTSPQTCLNGGTCQARCMKNGKRFQCFCPDGYSGDRCEVVPRRCAAYAQSSNLTHGLRLIHAPDNSTYSAFCHFRKYEDTMYGATLAMSYSKQNAAEYHGQSLIKDYPVSEDSHNWVSYRLSLARMIGLRDVSRDWLFTCSYPTRGWGTKDYMRVNIAKTDILTYTAASLGNCRLVDYISVGSLACSQCKVGMSQGGVMFHLSASVATTCSGWTGIKANRCADNAMARYFGSYICVDKNFECTTSASATTQLWFLSPP